MVSAVCGQRSVHPPRSEPYLSVPPPAQEGAVCYPSIQALFPKEVQVCADHVGLGVGSFLVCDDAVEIPSIIMAKVLVIPARGQSYIRRRGVIKVESTYPGSWKYLSASSSCLLIASRSLCSLPGFPNELSLKDGAATQRSKSVVEAMAMAHRDSRIVKSESRRAEQFAKKRN